MKGVYYVVLVVLLGVSVSCFSDTRDMEREEKEFDLDKYEYAYGNPDDDAIIERPCQVYDLNCIRQFFSKHAHCTIANGPIPDPLRLTQNTIYFPRINVTVMQNNLQVSGLNNTRIEEFYINKATNKVIFAIEVRNILLSSPSAYFRFYRRGREPIVSVAESGVLYRSLTFTSIIPNIDDMQLDKMEISTYAEDPVPPFYIGPSVANSPDPIVVQAVIELNADTATDVQEIMLTESLFYPPVYIQSNICDFGMKVL